MSYIIYKVKKRKRKEKEYVKGIYRSVWELILLTNLLTLGEIQTPMLSYQEFKDQLRTLPQSITNLRSQLSPNPYSIQTVYLQGNNEPTLSISIEPTTTDTPNDKNTSIFTRASTEYNTNLARLEFRVTYSTVYSEPLLLLRLWRLDVDDEIGLTTTRLWFPADINKLLFGKDGDEGNVPFRVSLDTFSGCLGGTWYFFHACDTGAIVGGECRQNYLTRWISVFLVGETMRER